MRPQLSRGGADAAVDLGTTTTRVVGRGRTEILSLPSVVALEEGAGGRSLVAVGEEALEMLGRAPAGTRVVRPIGGGRITDFAVAELLLTQALRQALGRSLVGPRLVLSTPLDLPDVDRRALAEVARAAGARQVSLVPSPITAALGAGLPLMEPLGSALLDVGGGHAEAAIVALGGVAVHEAVPSGGDALDGVLSQWLREHLELVVGPSALEALKREAGCLLEDPSAARGLPLRGRSLSTGQWTDVELDERDLVAASRQGLTAIRDGLLAVLRRASPELSSDIVERGVVLCGAGSLLTGLERFLSEATGLPVVRAEEPDLCNIRGALHLLDDAELLERVGL